jgi:hypothetical protein
VLDQQMFLARVLKETVRIEIKRTGERIVTHGKIKKMRRYARSEKTLVVT